MLVTYPDARMLVGIAVSQWQIDGKSRTFVIFPFNSPYHSSVDVDCACEEDGALEVISNKTKDWQPLENGFGNDAFGYPINDKSRNDLYRVWDNPVNEVMDQSKDLYKVYENIIEYYKKDANDYLSKHSESDYAAKIEEAKRNGWDSSIIKPAKATFPYSAQ